MEPQPFGKFLLVERLAQGGMAEVFRAVYRGAAGVEKTVALKRILPLLDAAPEFVRMFIDEARIAASLTHVNVAQVFEFGEAEGSYYLVMELVEGVDLGQLAAAALAQGRALPREAIAFIIAEAARGLAYAHEKRGADGALLGIVHRDVSPQNILISYAGEVKIADFGIAKAVGKLHKTDSGAIMGKLRYMSPEQVTGASLDGRSDLFSLAVVLWELVTGRPLFDGDHPGQITDQVKEAQIRPPSSVRPDIPSELDRICVKALSRSREARPARAADFARELSNFVAARAPGLTREDVGAWVAELIPRGTRPGSESADDSAARAATQRATTRPARPSAPRLQTDTEPTPAPRRRRTLALAMLGATALAGSAALIVRATGADSDPLALAGSDGGAAPQPSVDAGAMEGGARSVDPALAARLEAELEALPQAEAAWRGVPAEDYLALLSAVEGTLCAGGDPPPFPADVIGRLEARRLKPEATALARYLKKTGHLPSRVAESLRAFLRSGRPSFSPGAPGWALSGLALLQDPGDARRVVDLLRENGALHRWRERSPLVPAPVDGAALCDRESVVRRLGVNPLKAALDRYLAATPLDTARDDQGLRFLLFAAERDEAVGTLELRLRVTNPGPGPLPLHLADARLAALDSLPLLEPASARIAANSTVEIKLRFAGVTDALAEAAVLVLRPGIELAAYSEDLR